MKNSCDEVTSIVRFSYEEGASPVKMSYERATPVESNYYEEGISGVRMDHQRATSVVRTSDERAELIVSMLPLK